MKAQLSSRRFLTALLVSGFLLLILTRLITIRHNILIHPDEHVFFISAQRLMHSLLESETVYTQLVDYPEGAFVLHLPFHLVFALFTRITGRQISYRLIGRIASVCYFLVATGVGLLILKRYFENFRICAAVFLLTMTFGLMHIEQSRYGTGDPASFFLLMSLLALTAQATQKKNPLLFCASFFICGILGSIKYPQFYFLLIPLACILHIRRNIPASPWKWLLCPISLIAGFWFFSPTMLIDPMSAIRTLTTEFTNYVAEGNYTEHGGPLNHLAALTVYTLLYSGIPLIPALAAVRLIPALRTNPQTDTDFLFYRVIPAAIAGFFVYNLFVSTLFMRTYYPFFCTLDLYCAALCGKLWNNRRTRALTAALLSVMVLRGSWYLFVMAADNPQKTLEDIFSQADGSYKEITLLEYFNSLPFASDCLPEECEPTAFTRRFSPVDVTIRPGELVITGNMDYNWGQPYIFPVEDKYVPLWQQFKKENRNYYLGSLYPDYYYKLFGFWIKGTTGTVYEFPTVQFFLKPSE